MAKLSAGLDAALLGERRRNGNGPVSHLEHHLRQYTRRNSSDFFIHKDLKGFLSRELDFYLKNEVLNLDEMARAGEQNAEGWFQKMRLVKAVGSSIIDFLAQIENFQKMLWEKRKFVTESNYCITIRIIAPSFYPDIAANEKQWDEWQKLGVIDKDGSTLFTTEQGVVDRRISLLQTHPTLVVDTKHFEPEFINDLLASFNNIDEMVDGLLIHSENWQALNLLQYTFSKRIKCVYIDPPYNTGSSKILYKNDYLHSSWLSMLEDRLTISNGLLTNDGVLCCAIDDGEFWRLRGLVNNHRVLGVAAIRSNPVGRKSSGKFSPAHEYAVFIGMENAIPGTLLKTEKQLTRYPYTDDKGRYTWSNLIRNGSNDRREDSPRMFHPIFVSKKNELRVPKMKWNEIQNEHTILEKPRHDEEVILPIRDGIEKCWHRGVERIREEVNKYKVTRDSKSEIGIHFKAYMDEDAIPRTWWENTSYSSRIGTGVIKDLFGTRIFDYPKPPPLVEDCLRASRCDGGSYVLDYFAVLALQDMPL